MLFRTKKSIRLRKNLRNFRKKHVDVAKYVKDFYVDNGLAYISCNVKGYDDIIDPYSVRGYEWLNESFARFIESNAAYVPTEYPIVLEICNYRFTPKQQSVIEETISDYYALQQGDAQINLEKNNRKNLTLVLFILIGVAAMILSASLRFEVIKESIIVFFWFALWDLLDSAIFERQELVETRVDAAQMANIKVLFKEVYYDAPVSTEKEQEILGEIFNEETEEEESDE